VDSLVNPVWHALGGEQSAWSEVHGSARRFRSDVAVFASVPDAPTADDWDSLRTLVGARQPAFLLRAPIEPPAQWTIEFRLGGLQMVAERDGPAPIDPPDRELLVLDVDADSGDVLDLIARSNPGPFRARTMELGTYLGIRDDGVLVALSGERLRPPGAIEVSAVCTDPEFRGQGLAASLVHAVMARIRARNEVPFLHVEASNATAIRVYERLGFRVSREIEGLRLVAPA
jgi:ribosomal protein S18 acetylase RimI-like enzyme